MFKIIRKFYSNVEKLNMHKNLKDYFLKNNFDLTDIQKDIFQTINKEGNSILLCDEFSGRKFSTVLGLMNRILSNPNSYIEETDFYRSPNDIIRDSKKNITLNQSKKSLPPRGVLFISHKFDFITHYYKILRKLDFENRVKAVRLGNSLQSVTPSVEVDVMIINPA
jgi:hypothetical protein